MVSESLRRPYRVTLPMVFLVLLVPLYLFIPDFAFGSRMYKPELAIDRMIPVQPVWAIVYGALYMFLIVLPVLVVRQEELISRTVLAYLSVWITAYIVFLLYPTEAPRPEEVIGDGFAAWGLRALYDADPPYNCFPSLHVAHSFVSALACYRVHRRLGQVAIVCAFLVGLSTLFTKQHYIVDVIAGIMLALAAYAMFLRRYPRSEIPAFEERVAPALAVCVAAICTLGIAGYWVVYKWTGAA